LVGWLLVVVTFTLLLIWLVVGCCFDLFVDLHFTLLLLFGCCWLLLFVVGYVWFGWLLLFCWLVGCFVGWFVCWLFVAFDYTHTTFCCCCCCFVGLHTPRTHTVTHTHTRFVTHVWVTLLLLFVATGLRYVWLHTLRSHGCYVVHRCTVYSLLLRFDLRLRSTVVILLFTLRCCWFLLFFIVCIVLCVVCVLYYYCVYYCVCVWTMFLRT